MQHIKSLKFFICSVVFTSFVSIASLSIGSPIDALSMDTVVDTFKNGSATHSVIALPPMTTSPQTNIQTLASTQKIASIGNVVSDDVARDDAFKSYEKYLTSVKNGMSSVIVKKISFPVKKNSSSDHTFIRNGFLVTRPDALGTVIICHGYTQSKHESFFFRALFAHFNVLAFDFRAHGDLVEDQYSTIGQDEIYDVKGAVQFAQSNPDCAGKPMIGFGFSMGAVSLIMAQAHYGNLFDMLILDSPFDSSDVCMDIRLNELLAYKFLPGKKWIKAAIMKGLYSKNWQGVVKPIFKIATGLDPNSVETKFVPVIPVNIASKIRIPCFFITCENDKKVTVDSVQRLYDTVQSPFKRLWITQGTRHCGSCLAQPELYLYMVNKFIKKSLKGKWSIGAKIIDNRVGVSVG